MIFIQTKKEKKQNNYKKNHNHTYTNFFFNSTLEISDAQNYGHYSTCARFKVKSYDL